MNAVKRFRILFAVILVVAVAGLVRPALADGGGGPMVATDGRWNPNTLDRVAVYCHQNSVDILGIDTMSEGHYLMTFSLADLTSGKSVVYNTPLGTVTLYLDALPKTHIGYAILEATTPGLIVDSGTVYHAVWTGGDWGADGSAPFSKTFSCTYLPIAGQ